MLGFAVRRNRSSVVGQLPSKAKHREVHLSDLSESSYIICDAVPGFPIRHASQGFQDLLGRKASECIGSECPLGARQLSASLEKSQELRSLAKQTGLSAQEVSNSIQRMAEAAEAAQGAARSPLLLATKNSGELFVCEISWSKNTHPSLGWSYQAGLIQEISDISAAQLVVAASKESTYIELCQEWTETRAPRLDLPLREKLDSSKEALDAVAQKMWTDELMKETKQSKQSRTHAADTSSIWSRSTASTLASATSSAHHLGALFARQDDKEKGGDFWSVEESDEFDDCDAKSISRTSDLSEPPPLFDEVLDPVKHVVRSGLRNMKSAFAIAAVCEASFPIALRSVGLEEMGGPSLKVRLGGDAKSVLQPSDVKARAVWEDFCESVSLGEFYNAGRGSTTMLKDLQVTLSAGEFAFLEAFQGKLGNPIECLVYVKHVELDDCPYLLAMYSYLPESFDLEAEFRKVASQVGGVVYELAAEFFYHAPMHRQRNGDNTPPP